MSRARQSVFFLAAAALLFAAHAQNPSWPVKPAPKLNLSAPPPLPPTGASPVDFFRQLLAMSPAERNQSLTNRSPEIRARILAKVREYQALGPDERELRLRATEFSRASVSRVAISKRRWMSPTVRSP